MPGDATWIQLFTAAFGGGLTAKFVDVIYQEIRRRIDRSQSATTFVDQNLDPLLKSADEVVGKLHSLALEDFKSISHRDLNLQQIDNNDYGSLLYLLGKFWARIEIFRQEGMSIAIGRDSRGKRLQSFLACLESRKVRIVDRIGQRAIGELLVESESNPKSTISYIKFITLVETDGLSRRWVAPLADILSKTHHTTARQNLLQYGVVVHAMIDDLDPEHIVTGRRPSYPNKLSKKTITSLKYRVFKVYLNFVKDTTKYTYMPRKQGKGDHS